MDTDSASFFECVDGKGNNDTDVCWNWLGGIKNAYGGFWFRGVQWLAHRWSYIFFFGDIPEGLEIDHLCRNTLCVNPYHLEAVTHSVNAKRAENRSKMEQCKYGHDYTPENTRIRYKDGNTYRQCRTCSRNHKKTRRVIGRDAARRRAARIEHLEWQEFIRVNKPADNS